MAARCLKYDDDDDRKEKEQNHIPDDASSGLDRVHTRGEIVDLFIGEQGQPGCGLL